MAESFRLDLRLRHVDGSQRIPVRLPKVFAGAAASSGQGAARSEHRDLVALDRKAPWSVGRPIRRQATGGNWERQLPSKTVHVYGDFALTKYYNPLDSIGLEYEWVEIGEYLEKIGSREAIILGTPLGPEREPFDPGGIGSYFQSEATVRNNLTEVEQLLRRNRSGLEKLQPVATMLGAAAKAERGLYITF
jgi:hypothetical protein